MSQVPLLRPENDGEESKQIEISMEMSMQIPRTREEKDLSNSPDDSVSISEVNPENAQICKRKIFEICV